MQFLIDLCQTDLYGANMNKILNLVVYGRMG